MFLGPSILREFVRRSNLARNGVRNDRYFSNVAQFKNYWRSKCETCAFLVFLTALRTPPGTTSARAPIYARRPIRDTRCGLIGVFSMDDSAVSWGERPPGR